jgi:protein SCO1
MRIFFRVKYMTNKGRLFLGVLIAISAIVTIGAFLSLSKPQVRVESSLVGGEFRLTTHDSKTVTEKSFLGAPFVIFFGYTHCPDICPTVLFEISEALKATGKKGEKIRALFITVDPERDTAEVLKRYISSFDPRIIGLTGTQDEIKTVVKAYRSYYKKVPTTNGDYTMDHTTGVYLMSSTGQFIRLLDMKRPPDQIARELINAL